MFEPSVKIYINIFDVFDRVCYHCFQILITFSDLKYKSIIALFLRILFEFQTIIPARQHKCKTTSLPAASKSFYEEKSGQREADTYKVGVVHIPALQKDEGE